MSDFKIFIESSSSFLKEQILGSKFFKEIRYMGGRVHFVGGYVRDFHLGLDSKDVDIIVQNIPHDQLEGILEKHGKVSKVGESFGVLKFVPNEFEVIEPIDIAIPRTERPMSDKEKEEYKARYGKSPSAYQAFKTEPDHSLRVEDDLFRRDYTINAMAQDHLGNIVDPYGGMKDIESKQLRMVNPKNFSDDPLRMLRGVQFAARFGFKIEPETFDVIKSNADLIRGIPGERILIEIEKIVKKGDQLLGANLLCETTLWQKISELPCSNHSHNSHLFQLSNISRTVSEFLFLMLFKVASFNEASALSKRLKCDLVTEKQIKGLYYAWGSKENPNLVVYNLNRVHPTCLQLYVLPDAIKDSVASGMPKSIKDLPVNGNDLINLGLKNELISKAFNDVMMKIFEGELVNSKESILSYLSKNINKSFV